MQWVKAALGRAGRNWHMAVIVMMFVAAHGFSLFNFSQPLLSEKRALAAWPSVPMTWADVGALPEAINAYIADHFPPRLYLIAALNTFRYRMGYSGSDRVIVGLSGWLFYDADEKVRFNMGERLAQRDLDVWVEGVKNIDRFVLDHGARLYMMFPPYKPTIYPEKLPSWVAPDPVTPIDQRFAALKQAGLDITFDIRPDLLNAKQKSVVYYAFDTHWNAHGAEIGAKALLARIHRDFPDIDPVPTQNFTTNSNPGIDLAGMLGIVDSIDKGEPGNVSLTGLHGAANNFIDVEWLGQPGDVRTGYILRSGVKNGHTLLLIGDSFSVYLIPMIYRNFETLIFAGYARNGVFRKDVVEQYHPDIIVNETIEPSAGAIGCWSPDSCRY